MKIVVYGAGGVGAYFGGRLANAGADVHLIARGPHLDALREDGLKVESIHGDFEVDLPATDDPAEVGECDVVLFCVKSFDTASAARRMEPLLGKETAVISLQNGVDNEEKLADEIGREHVLGGVTYIFSTIGEPGTIEHTDGPARIVYGELDGERSDRIERFHDRCERADGMEGVLSADIWTDLWNKYALIAAVSSVTAAIRLPIGNIREVDESWELFVGILEEVQEVAAAEGVHVADEVIDNWIAFARDLDRDTYSSLHYDMTNGKRMEVDALQGTVVRKADEHGVDAPRTRTVYSILRPWAVKNAGD
ncbi:ketopantoate reductase family protein [Halosolutus gelatinilyticus]|uniref:ketopantoate reductase family protein n=1 Tax=Halosolutus gelatinilyticus TaxID=2931975 RepID=UPI001FF55D7B|nr:2-dehydropantoate 2-reductase [Halosolutus gelatinilyticus]